MKTPRPPKRAFTRRDDHQRPTIRPEGCLPQAQILENMYLSLVSMHLSIINCCFYLFWPMRNIKNLSQIHESDLSSQCSSISYSRQSKINTIIFINNFCITLNTVWGRIASSISLKVNVSYLLRRSDIVLCHYHINYHIIIIIF